MKLYLIQTEYVGRWYAHINYSWVAESGGPRLVKYHKYGARNSSLSTPMYIPPPPPSSGAPDHPLHSRSLLQHTHIFGITQFTVRLYVLQSVDQIHGPFALHVWLFSPQSQVLFYDGHVIHFDNRKLKILQSHHIRAFILKPGDSVHDCRSDNGPNMQLNKLYENSGMNWMWKNGNLKFTLVHINSILV